MDQEHGLEPDRHPGMSAAPYHARVRQGRVRHPARRHAPWCATLLILVAHTAFAAPPGIGFAPADDSIGVGHPTHPTSNRFIPFTRAPGAGRVTAGGDADVPKAGIEWKSAPSPVQMMRGGLGVPLDSAGKMSLRLRGGTVGLYLRSEF